MKYSNFQKNFFRLVKDSNSILIVPHRDPDTDALASALSLRLVIGDKYPDKKITTAVLPVINQRLKNFPGFSQIEVVEDIIDYVKISDLVIFVDGHYDDRFANDIETLKNYEGKTVCFDHHPYESVDYDLSIIDPSSTSTCEVIYRALLEKEKKLKPELCKILLAGILGDTNRFLYITPAQANVFQIVDRLMSEGSIDMEDLVSQTSVFNENVYTVFAEFVKNTQFKQIEGLPKLMVSYITQRFIQNGGFTDLEVGDAKDEFGAYLKSLSDVPWGFVVYPQGSEVKVSFRSRSGFINVRSIVEQMGIGSGHILAAAGRFSAQGARNIDVRGYVEKIFNWISENKNLIQYD